MTELVVADSSIFRDPLDLLKQHEYLGRTALDLPPSLPYDQYVQLGWRLRERHDETVWWIAEWILFGERVHGSTYSQAAEILGLSPDTLKNYVSTAHRVPRERRREELKFGHHTEVASLEPADQTVWLDKAVTNGWTRAELRSHLRPVKGLPDITPALPSLEDAARALVAAASQYGGDYLVKRHLMSDLKAALGEIE
jgi:hypothetical protein